MVKYYYIQCYFHVGIKVPYGLCFLFFNPTITKFSYLILSYQTGGTSLFHDGLGEHSPPPMLVNNICFLKLNQFAAKHQQHLRQSLIIHCQSEKDELLWCIFCCFSVPGMGAKQPPYVITSNGTTLVGIGNYVEVNMGIKRSTP